MLTLRDVTKTFNARTLFTGANMTVNYAERVALVGPNGAGKSTLINQLCGELVPDEGAVFLGGQDVTAASVPDRVALGLGRTFQITNLLTEMSVRDNIAMAVQARMGRNFRIWDAVARRRALWAETDGLLAGTALDTRAHVPVAGLSHGEKKQLELLVALARKPQLLLLDEPMAGLGAAESHEMIVSLRQVAQATPMLLVEHDMEAVFALATRISVLVYGRIIASGSVEEIRANPEVREAYLGAEDELC